MQTLFLVNQAESNILLEVVESYRDNLANLKNELLHSGRGIAKDNSYSDSGTGHNFVSDVEYTPEFLGIEEKLDVLFPLISKLEETASKF